jgi:outer membrane protein assembly factor BamB
MNRRIRVLSLALLGALGTVALAADWPQWRGPRRDGTTKETGLLKQWPAEGPRMLWKNDTVGGGYSTPSVVGKHVYLLGDKDKQEYLIVLDSATGKEVRRSKVGPVAQDGPPSYPGARSTPTVDGEAIYVLGSDGDLLCFGMNGDVKWKKNLKTDFAGRVGQWAYAESPLVDGNVVVCTPGGEKATLLALNMQTGATIWESAVPGGDAAGYASVLPIEVGGVRQYVQFLAKGVVGVDAKTGKLLWRYAQTFDPAATIPTPVFHDDCIFTSTSRKGTGLNRLRVQDGTVRSEQVYFNTTKLNSTGGVVLVGDYVYGTDDKGQLVCMEFKTGEVKWQDPSVGAAALCYADGMLYVRGQGGSGFGPESPAQVALVEASPHGYQEHGRFEQPHHGNRPAWPHPVVANGCLYLRDQGVLFCYAVRAAK